MKTILHFFRVHAEPSVVYRALTTDEGLSNWWTRRVQAEQQVGGHVRFHFLEGFNPVMQITALDEAAGVGWKCVDGHDKWADNTFRFDLRAVDGETDLTFVQEYAVELSDEDYGQYNFNWGYYLNSLKRYCEAGEGAPFNPSG